MLNSSVFKEFEFATFAEIMCTLVTASWWAWNWFPAGTESTLTIDFHSFSQACEPFAIQMSCILDLPPPVVSARKSVNVKVPIRHGLRWLEFLALLWYQGSAVTHCHWGDKLSLLSLPRYLLFSDKFLLQLDISRRANHVSCVVTDTHTQMPPNYL